MKKKLMALISATLVVSMLFTACGSKEEAPADEPAVEEETDRTVQTADDFNIALYGATALSALAAAEFCLRRKTCK